MSATPDDRPPALPRIAISVGDVAGVGPELALRCVATDTILRRCIPVLIGPVEVIRYVADMLDLPCPPIHHGPCGDVAAPCMIDPQRRQPDTPPVSPRHVTPGRFDAVTGRLSFDAVEFAIEAALARDVAAIVTGPIQKEAWYLAEIDFPGHTELLATRTGATDVRMMLTSPAISCLLVTIHVPHADVAAMLHADAIFDSIAIAHATMSRRLRRSPRIAVCGLNPHAGENGLFSHGEEAESILPAILRARRAGMTVAGPLSPDTAFTPAIRNATDVYVCMYHDQGLIPLKALAFDDAVNVTLGLPIVRTSVDHGTAMDIAWQGVASHNSFLAAIEMAIDLAAN